MAHKYLTVAGTYTVATKTIAGVTMNTVFVSADAGRQVMFRSGTSLYYGRVSSYVSGTSIVLTANGSLPASNGAVDELFLFDLSEVHTYQSYLDQIGTYIQDDDTKLATAEIERMLQAAVTLYGNHKPFYIKKKITGTDLQLYSLSTIFGSLWIHGFSVLRSIEYPYGEVPPVFIASEDYTIYDDGTAQDGSNLRLVFNVDTPSTAEYFVAEILTKLDLPATGVQNFPDTNENFQNITLLSSAFCCRVLAALYAKSSDSTISADVVNYHDKTSKYTQLAKEYLKQYNLNVFGDETQEKSFPPAVVDLDIDLPASSGASFIFHGGRNR